MKAGGLWTLTKSILGSLTTTVGALESCLMTFTCTGGVANNGGDLTTLTFMPGDCCWLTGITGSLTNG